MSKAKFDYSKHVVVSLKTGQLVDSKLNVRTTFVGLEELGASMKKQILTPLIVRPTATPNEYEIVCGHRRKRAALMAHIDDLPGVIRELSDLEVLDLQAVENQDREALTPLEEAALYASYIERGIHPKAIAERVSRPLGYVMRRLKLRELIAKAQEAVALGPDQLRGITLGAAEALACYPSRVQDIALAHLWKTEVSPAMIGARAKDWLVEKFTLKLAGAPFDAEDAGLVPAATKCSACPKRTGNQRELFFELSEDTCTDPACYESKVAETWKRTRLEYVARGFIVLDDNETREAFGWGQQGGFTKPVSAKYVDLDAKVWAGEKEQTYRALLGGKSALKGVKVRIARHPTTHEIFELLDAKEAATLAEKRVADGKLGDVPAPLTPLTEAAKERKKERLAKTRETKTLLAFVMGALVDAISKRKKLDERLARLLARLIVDASWTEVQSAVAARRALVDASSNVTCAEALYAHIEQLPPYGCLALIFELGAMRGLTGKDVPELRQDGVLGQAAAALELEWAQLTREAKQDEKRTEKKAPKKGAPTTANHCRVCGCTDLDPCEGLSSHDVCTWIDKPEAHKGVGLCSACVNARDEVIKVVRSARARRMRFADIVVELDRQGFVTSGARLKDTTKCEQLFVWMCADGIVSRAASGKKGEVYVTLEREPGFQGASREEGEE